MAEEPEEPRDGTELTRRRRPLRLILIALAGWAAVSLVILVLGALALHDARGRLGRAEAELSIANLSKPSAPNAERVAKSLDRAHSMFGSPIVAPLRLVPVLGRQLRAVAAMAHAGNVVAEVGLDARRRVRPIVAVPPADGQGRLAALETIRDIARDGRRRLEAIDFGPSDHLFSPLANTRTTFAIGLNRVGELLQRADYGSGGLLKFFKGPSRYAVFAANNAEMRAGSGMLLSGGLLEVTNGNLSLGPMRGIGELPPAPNNVALEYDFLRLWGPQAPGSDYRFVNMTPRFPTSGALLQRMWSASGAPSVDGVLVLDPVAVAELVKVTGPLEVDGQRISAGNVSRVLLHDQYVTYDEAAGEKPERRDFLTDVVEQIFIRLNAGKISPTRLGSAFGHAAAGRHILAWSSDRTVQLGWSAVRMDGVLPDQSVLFALQNRGGNKLDYFQAVTATVQAGVGDEGSVVDVDFRIKNTVPAGEPVYIAGPADESYVQRPGVYVGIAAINVPANAGNVTLTGGDFDLVRGPDGNMQVVSQWLEIDPGEEVALKLSFSLPPGYRALSVEPSARVPGIAWRIGNRSWVDTSARIITW